MRLKAKLSSIDAAGKIIIILDKSDAAELGLSALDRVVLKKRSKKITALINVAEKSVHPGYFIAYKKVAEMLNLKNGDIVELSPREELISKQYIRKKVDGGELNYKEALMIVKDIIDRDLNDLELSSFITALYIYGLSMNENVALSKAMIATGKRMKFHGTVVDKHSVGGVPGDKTSILLVPIIASRGLTIPKTSSRSITSPAGTADRMEVLAPVELDTADIKRVVKKTNACLVWGGALELAPADDLFIQIENPLRMDPLILPSVMSKKKSVGSKYVVIDIPMGPEAKIIDKKQGENLASEFISLGKQLKMDVDCAITRGDQPIGYAVGPALEAREALETIIDIERSPELVDKVTTLAGMLLKMVKKGNKKTALDILKKGKAENKLREIIGAQGGDSDIRPEDIELGKYCIGIKSKSTGFVVGIHNQIISAIAKTAGCPKDKKSGVLLYKKINDRVKKDEILFTIYAEKKRKLSEAVKIAQKMNAFEFMDNKRRPVLVEKIR